MKRRLWFRCVGRRAKSKNKTKGNNVHTQARTVRRERDRCGCHARPPSVRNERHSPFCSGAPTVNTIPSHWASFPLPPFICPSFLSAQHFLPQPTSEPRRSECAKRAGERKRSEWRGEEGGAGSRSAGQLGDQRGSVLVTSPSTRPIYWQGLGARERLLYLGICGALLGGWRVVDGVGGTVGSSTSLAARQSALWDPAACWTAEEANTMHPHTRWGARSELRQDGRWDFTNTNSTDSLTYLNCTPVPPSCVYLNVYLCSKITTEGMISTPSWSQSSPGWRQ